ncbi:MAG: cache domain-containing protein, partial [Psychrosphaera sp.]|nr:cache domain-containing protein [Psychrosphaera sp.]
MKLKQKLLIIFFSITLIPILITGLAASNIASSSLEALTFEHLRAIREAKKSEVLSYFSDRKNDIELLSSTVKGLLDTSSVDALNQSAHANQSYFDQYIKGYQYYDLFLIDQSGQIFYTVTREADYQSNLTTGPYRDSGLGELFKDVSSNNQYSMNDFSRYAPSNNDPASFIAYPFKIDTGETIILALQLSIDKINAVMQQREGMGDTGES